MSIIVHKHNIFDQDGDVDMYSDSGDDVSDSKPLFIGATKEQGEKQERSVDEENSAKRKRTSKDPVDPVGIQMEHHTAESKPMEESEHEGAKQLDEDMDTEDSALIKEEECVESCEDHHGAEEKGKSLHLERSSTEPELGELS